MLIKKSISLKKHRTSLSLEKEFWDSLELIAKKKNCSLQQLISEIDVERKSSLASSKFCMNPPVYHDVSKCHRNVGLDKFKYTDFDDRIDLDP